MSDYFENPLKYAQNLMNEGDRLYSIHKGDISKAKDHYLLKSDHLQTRAAVDGRSGHYFPELHPAIKTRAANIWDVLTSGEPPIKLTANNLDIEGIEESVQRLEDYINDCYEAGGIWEDIYYAIVNAEMYPYAPIYLDWEDEWGQVPIYNNANNAIDYEDSIVYSGPTIYALQPEDYRGDLYARSQGIMRYHFIIKDVSSGYIQQRGQQGYYNKYNPASLQLAANSDWQNKRLKERFVDNYTKPEDYKHELIVGFISVYNPKTEDETIRQITFAGDAILDEKEWYLASLGMPFELLCSNQLPGEVTGTPTAKLGMANQNMINELWNQRIEANEQAIWSPTVFKGDITSNPVWEPQALWQVSQDFEHRPLVKPNLSGSLVEDIRFLEERTQQTLAAYDTIQPVKEKSKQTLGEYAGKKESHAKILSVNFKFYAKAISRMTKMMIGMARTRLPDWIEIGMLGGNSILDKLTIADLASDVTIDIPKVRALANEELEIMKWGNLYPMLMQNPLVMSNPNSIYEVTERFLSSQGEKNIDEILGQKPQQAIGGMYG